MRLWRVVIALGFVAGLFVSAICTYAQTEPLYENGLKPYGTYDGGALDSISRSGAKLSLHIPLVSYSQRGGKLHAGFFLAYQNPVWSYSQVACLPHTACQYYWVYNQPPNIVITPDFVTRLDVNEHIFSPGNTVTYFDVVSPDGALHQMWSTTGNALTLDGTGTQYNPTTNVVVDRDGIQSYYGATVGNPLPTQIQDSNGNYIAATFSGSAQTGWTDTLGRALPLPPNYGLGGVTTTNYTGCTGTLPVSLASLWNLPGPSGGTYTVKVCYAKVQIRTNFAQGQGNPNSHEATAQVTDMQSIVLPDGTAWTFTWDSADPNNTTSYAYGNLLKITLPTGGSISYMWLNTAPACHSQTTQYPENSYFEVTSRTVNDGSTNQTWTYTGPQTTTTITDTVIDPLQNQTVHTLTALGSGTCSFYEVQTQYYQGTQTLLKTVATQYGKASASPWNEFSGDVGADTLINVVPTSVTTTWPNGQSTTVTTAYDAGISLGNAGTVLYGNPVDKYEYDFTPSGALLRHTHTNYKAFVTSSYLTAGLLDLPSSVIVYNGAGAQVASTTYGYDETSLTSSGITKNVGPSFISGSPRGNETSVARWLSNGSATSTTSCPVSIASGGSATSTALFYDTGMVYKDADPCKNSTTYAYLSTYYGAYPTTITNALNQSVTHTYDFNTGLVTQTKDPNLQPTNYSYTSMWRIYQIGYPDTGNATFTYQVATTPFYVTRTRTMTPSPSAVTSVVFDGLGRETRRISANGETIPDDQVETCYDGLGRKSFVSYPYQSTGLSSSHFCSGLGDSFLYDTLGRTLTVTHSDGTKITTSYAGSATEVADEGNGVSNVTRISQIDGLGRLIDLCEISSKTLIGTTPTPSSCGLEISGTGFLTAYSYDGLGNLLSVAQGGLSGRSFSYDSLSRVTSATNPESGQTRYSYDANGNVIGKTDARSAVTTLTYDILNRLTAKSSTVCGTPNIAMNYEETSAFGLTLTYTVGRVSSTTSTYPSSSCNATAMEFGNVFSYDKMGRILNNSQCFPSFTCPSSPYPLSYTYDLGGNKLTSLYGGVTMSEAYNAASRAITVTSNYGTPNLISSAQYNAFGVAVSDTLGNDLTETRATAPRGWLQSLTVGPSTSPSYDFNITSFAPDGDILAATDSANGSWTYTYDDFNRLSTGTATGQAYTYDYDRFGNRWHQNGPHSMMISFTGNNNRMDTYSYDAAGNLLNDGVHTYAYDGYGNLASVDGGNTANYYYNADGQRVRKNANGSVTNYIYNLEGEQIAEFDVSGNWIRGEMFASGKHVATYYLGATYFNHSDWLGTERARTPAAGGSPCETTASLPFGDGQVQAGSCDAPSNRHFTGKERDLESGLDDFDARYYSSSLGRFVASDWSEIPEAVPYAEFTDPQSLNLYIYVRDNPATRTDLNGHCDPGPACAMQVIHTISNFADHPGQYVNAFFKGVLKQELSNIRQNVSLKPDPNLAPSNDVERAGASLLNSTAEAAAVVLPIFAGGEGGEPEGGFMGPKEGNSGGEGAGAPFAPSVMQGAVDENAAANGGPARCVYCGDKVSNDPGPNKVNIDHVKARSKGGNYSLENAQVTCQYCNQSKGTGPAPKNPKPRLDQRPQ